MRHIIGIRLQNEAGALSRVAVMFSSRGFNIESLAVAPTNDAGVSRLTLVTTGADAVIQQIVNQLNKLVDVVSVDDMTGGNHVERELLLAKVQPGKDGADALRRYVQDCGGRLVESDAGGTIIELVGSEAAITGFLDGLATRATLLDVVRSGALGVSRRAAAAG
jgi:acetolactate synthase I/III small subunit